MKEQKIRKVLKRNATALALLILSIIGMVLSIMNYWRSIEQLERDRFKENVREQAKIRLESTKDYISDMVFDLSQTGELIAEYDSIWEPQVREILETANRMDLFTFTSVVDREGHGFAHTGKELYVAHEEYFESAMQGHVSFSDVRPSKAMPGKYVQIFACPIWSEEHQVEGAVLGVVEQDELNQAIRKKYMKSEGNLYIVDSNGSYIGLFQLETDVGVHRNFWDDLQAISGLDKEISDIKADFSNRKGGDFSYTEGGEKRYGSYMPIGTRNWQIVYTMEDTSVAETLSTMFHMDTKYTFFLSACYLIWILCVVWYFKRTNREISRAHQEVSNNIEILHIALEYSKQPIFEYDQQRRELRLKTDFPNPLFQGISEVMTPQRFVEKKIIAVQSVPLFLQIFENITNHPSAQADIQINTQQEAQWWRISLYNVYEDNKIAGTVGFLEDITELKRMEQQSLQKLELQDALIAQALLYAKVDLTSGQLVEINGEEIQMPFDAFLQQKVCACIAAEDRQTVERNLCIQALCQKSRHGVDVVETQFRMERLGTTKWVSCTEYHHPANMATVVLLIHDIDDKKRKELALQQQAERDGLTGLYNALTTRKKIEEALAYGYLSGEKQVFVLFDLDNYKLINDTFGHRYGDQVLVDVAQMLQKRFRSSDIIGRMGGDEFVLLLRNMSSDQYTQTLIRELCAMLHQTYTEDGRAVTLSASIGVACAPEDGHTFSELYEKSDIALYQVKRQKKNGYKRYTRSEKKEFDELN